MKKFLVLLSLAFAVYSAPAQKKGKIKGNKEVLIKKFDLPHFTALDLDEHFKVRLQKAIDTTRVIIETDDNLFDVIHFKVENGVLQFYTTMEIVKKKRLRITIFVPEDFNRITLHQHAEVFNDENLNLSSLTLETNDKTKANLNLHLKDKWVVNALGKSESDIEVYAGEAAIYLSEDAFMKGVLNIKKLSLTMDDHAKAKLSGEVAQMTLKIKEKAKIDAVELNVKKAVIKAFDKASLEITVKDLAELYLSGHTKTFLYGNPKIKLKAFEDNAILYKK